MVHSLPLANNIANWWIDQLTWTFLSLYFFPYRTPELWSDVDRFVSQYSLNGMLCRPSR